MLTPISLAQASQVARNDIIREAHKFSHSGDFEQHNSLPHISRIPSE